MKWTRWQWGCLLLVSLPAAVTAQALRISVYTPAGTVNKYLSTPGDRAKAAAVMARFQVSKIWIEGRRGDQYVTPELLGAARDDFRTRGLLVSGGFTTVPSKTFGVPSNPDTTVGRIWWLNFQAAKTQADIAKFYTENAAIFDEIMVDDFYATEDTTPESEKARGNLSWSEYRRKLLVSLIDSAMLKPARAVRPETRVIIKFPQWYEAFQIRGYDPPGMAAAASQIWVGTETRNPRTASFGFMAPTAGYINFRWLAANAKEKIGGAWFDHLDCTAQNFVDQAYESVLAGARELTLFNLGDLMEGHPGQPLFIAALPELSDLAEKVRGRAVDGVYYYKPPASDGMENAYLMDYLAVIGLPLLPQASYPDGARVLVLGRHAGADAQLLPRIKQHLSRGATLVLTPALVRMMGKPLADLSGVKVSEKMQAASADAVDVHGQRLSLAKPLEIDEGLDAPRGLVEFSAFVNGRPVPLLTARKVGRGRILVWNLFTFANGGRSLPPRELGLPEIPQPLADALRGEVMAPLGVRLESPTKVGFYMFGDARAFYNFRDEDVVVRLNGKAIELGANRLLWQHP
jgi:hypothetical protein